MSDITYFATGDSVPEWVVSCIMKGNENVKGTFTFARPTAVVELKDRLWILPLDDIFGGGTFIELRDAEGFVITAPDRDVTFALASPFFGLDAGKPVDGALLQ